MVKIQTSQDGRKKAPLPHRGRGFRSPRDGRFIEEIGTYDP